MSEWYWLAVFEKLVWVASPADGSPHPINQKWMRSGEVGVPAGAATVDLVQDIVNQCKATGAVPEDALHVSIQFVPATLAPITSS